MSWIFEIKARVDNQAAINVGWFDTLSKCITSIATLGDDPTQLLKRANVDRFVVFEVWKWRVQGFDSRREQIWQTEWAWNEQDEAGWRKIYGGDPR